MMNSKLLLVQVYSFIILGLLGFLDATYLTAKHYVGGPIVCPIFGGCEKVLSSQYSMIGFLPVAMLGMFFYGCILILTVAYCNSQEIRFFKLAAILACLGFLASLVFMFIQFFVIQSICFYCLISAIISTLLFILGVNILKTLRCTLECF